MTQPHLLHAGRRLLAGLIGRLSDAAAITLRPLAGGTEATGVYLLTANYRDHVARARTARFVIKHLRHRAAREGRIFSLLATRHAGNLAPRLQGQLEDATGTYLALEAITRAGAWPWRHAGATAGLMHQLGAFHRRTLDADIVISDWDYEAELEASTLQTLEMLGRCRSDPDFSALARHWRALERVASELPRLRGMLLADPDFPARPIHGDVHPGNAMVRRRSDRHPVLIDWGRARFGSPLEDVSSMLQTLRFHEPVVLQRHDTLMKEYLTGLGKERRIGDGLRSAYWLAGASNAFAGALDFHLRRAADASLPAARRHSAFAAAQDWLRVVRRAHAWAL